MKDINDICFIIQARLSSERVPRKMMKNFAGTSLVDIACKKINQSKIIPKKNFYFSAYEDEIKEVVISACCPLLNISTIDSFVKSYMNSPHDGMFSVIAKKNYFWDKDFNMITSWPKEADVLNTKLVGVTYEAAHCLYAGRLDTIKDGVWMSKPPFVKNSPALFVVPEYETFDIDYNWQFEVAESLYNQKNNR